MRIVCIGGGPGGLYLAILLKKADPTHDITVLERNARGETFGWGVVFSDETLGYLEENDPQSHEEIRRTFAHWDAIDVHFSWAPGARTRSVGHGFSGISRRALLEILGRRAEALGVVIEYGRDVVDVEALRASCDLLVAADGLNSRTRALYEGSFRPTLERRKARYIWLGTKQKFEAFTFLFAELPSDPRCLFQVHAYRFDADTSTFIVETDEESFARAGLADLDLAAQLALLEGLFAEHLGGHKLESNRSSWLTFQTLRCEAWSHENVVLLGDACHTAHFSIGSGTKLAMEDSISLAAALADTDSPADLPQALAAYDAARRLTVEKTQAAAEDSLRFFEHTRRYLHFDPLAFTFRLLTRSKKIGYDNLAVRDPGFVEEVTRHFDARAGVAAPPESPAVPPMFTPFALRGMRLVNRVVVSPMCMYSAQDGLITDFHFVHYGSRAIGGAGLVMSEMTCVSADARITPGCAGLYTDAQEAAWARVVAFVHQESPAKIGLQLGHAGRKGATKLMWEGMDEPLDPAAAWPLVSASPLPYFPHSQTPKEMDAADMARVLGDFVAAAERGARAGFDLLELHMGHGYLLASFLSPLTNTRTDAYGGGVENRLRFPLEVFAAVRAVWPAERPMSVRFSATDWAAGGNEGADAVAIARALGAAGCDVVDVSTGQTVPGGRPAFYGRMFQAPFADEVRNEARLPAITVGNISTADQANTLLAGGRADLVAIGRGHLRDPYFTLHAALEAGYDEQFLPNAYGVVRAMGRPG
ncbi:MAG TPA: bifunctional salicylyl-CoA 5-hydroxylase/oxidoreductase [Polyangiaceae bacterium]|nr:bifunctional salicylyl-CoA 5-hydroxylase/oxidoreductase [Polyangiaceae bacterium]